MSFNKDSRRFAQAMVRYPQWKGWDCILPWFPLNKHLTHFVPFTHLLSRCTSGWIQPSKTPPPLKVPSVGKSFSLHVAFHQEIPCVLATGERLIMLYQGCKGYDPIIPIENLPAGLCLRRNLTQSLIMKQNCVIKELSRVEVLNGAIKL